MQWLGGHNETIITGPFAEGIAKYERQNGRGGQAPGQPAEESTIVLPAAVCSVAAAPAPRTAISPGSRAASTSCRRGRWRSRACWRSSRRCGARAATCRRVLNGMGRFALGGMVPRSMPAFATGGLAGGSQRHHPVPRPAGDRRPARLVRRGRPIAPGGGAGAGPLRWPQAEPVFLMPSPIRCSRSTTSTSAQYAVRGITMTLEPIDQAKNAGARLPRRAGRHLAGAVPAIQGHRSPAPTTRRPNSPASGPARTSPSPASPASASAIAGDVLIILAKVTTWNTSRDEWAAEMAWQLEAEQRDLI